MSDHRYQDQFDPRLALEDWAPRSRPPVKGQGVYFVADSSFHGWTHEWTGKVWDHPQEAARDFIRHCDERDAELAGNGQPADADAEKSNA